MKEAHVHLVICDIPPRRLGVGHRAPGSAALDTFPWTPKGVRASSLRFSFPSPLPVPSFFFVLFGVHCGESRAHQ